MNFSGKEWRLDSGVRGILYVVKINPNLLNGVQNMKKKDEILEG